MKKDEALQKAKRYTELLKKASMFSKKYTENEAEFHLKNWLQSELDLLLDFELEDLEIDQLERVILLCQKYVKKY